MALRIAAVAPTLLSTLLLPVLAFAAPAEEVAVSPEETPAIEGSPAIEVAPVEAAEASTSEATGEAGVEAGVEVGAGIEAGEATVAPEATTAELASAELSEAELAAIELAIAESLASQPVDDYTYEEEWEEEWEHKSKRTVLELQSGYFGVGIAPGATIHDRGFHPNTRFELEFGGTLEHEFRDVAWSFGVVSHVTPYYGRKKPSFGADVTSTAMLGPIYVRTGIGAVGGLPRNHQLENTVAALGGVVGVGLNFGRAPMVRLGVDYDFRVTTKLEPVHTVFVALRVACCRTD